MPFPSLAIAACRAVASADAATLAEIRRLREDLAARDDHIAELEELLGLHTAPPQALRLAPTPRRILGLLMARQGWVSIAAIETALYAGRPEADRPATCTVRVHIHHLRCALDVHDIAIETVPAGDSVGYWLAPPMRQKLAALLSSPADQLSPTSNNRLPSPSPRRRKRILLQSPGVDARDQHGGVR